MSADLSAVKLRIAGIVNDSITDGPGLRLTVFAQGCHHHCPGCHNPQTHDPEGGDEMGAADILAKLENNPLLDGLTLSGGEPFAQPEAMAALAGAARERGYSVIVYTGYTWEDLFNNAACLPLLASADYIIDGPFVEAQKSYELNFMGSSNQRIIDAARSLEAGRAVVLECFS